MSQEVQAREKKTAQALAEAKHEPSERYRPAEPTPIELERIRFIREGEELDAKVTRIIVGRVRDLIPIDKIEDEDIREYYLERQDRPAIKIEFIVPDLGIRGEDTIIFSLHPNSRYVKISRRYGEIKVGDTIKVVNEAGKLKIV